MGDGGPLHVSSWEQTGKEVVLQLLLDNVAKECRPEG